MTDKKVMSKVKTLLKKGNKTRVTVKSADGKRTYLNIPMNMAALAAVAAPALSGAGLGFALLKSCKINIESKD